MAPGAENRRNDRGDIQQQRERTGSDSPERTFSLLLHLQQLRRLGGQAGSPVHRGHKVPREQEKNLTFISTGTVDERLMERVELQMSNRDRQTALNGVCADVEIEWRCRP